MKLFLSLFLLLSSISAFAQYESESKFIVFHNRASKGKLKTISGTDKLTISPKDTVVLLHNSGKYFTMSDLGTYSIAELEEFLTDSEQFMPSELVGEFLKSDLFLDYDGMVKTGSVDCGITFNYITFPPNPLKRSSPIIRLYNHQIVIEYLFDDEFKALELDKTIISFTNLLEEPIADAIVIPNGFHLEVELDKEIIYSEKLLNNMIMFRISQIGDTVWRESYQGKEEYEKSVKIHSIPTRKIEAVIILASEKETKELSCLQKQLGAENYLAHALFFESEEYLMDAYFAYKKAIEQNPTNSKAQILFRMFRNRNSMGEFRHPK